MSIENSIRTIVREELSEVLADLRKLNEWASLFSTEHFVKQEYFMRTDEEKAGDPSIIDEPVKKKATAKKKPAKKVKKVVQEPEVIEPTVDEVQEVVQEPEVIEPTVDEIQEDFLQEDFSQEKAPKERVKEKVETVKPTFKLGNKRYERTPERERIGKLISRGGYTANKEARDKMTAVMQKFVAPEFRKQAALLLYIPEEALETMLAELEKAFGK